MLASPCGYENEACKQWSSSCCHPILTGAPQKNAHIARWRSEDDPPHAIRVSEVAELGIEGRIIVIITGDLDASVGSVDSALSVR